MRVVEKKVKLNVKEKGFKKQSNKFLSYEFTINIISYMITLFIASKIFDNTIYISTNNMGFWYFISAIIIFFLNKTIKPILTICMVPINILTLGLTYPLINFFILKITEVLTLGNFKIHNLILGSIVALFINFTCFIIENYMKKKGWFR